MDAEITFTFLTIMLVSGCMCCTPCSIWRGETTTTSVRKKVAATTTTSSTTTTTSVTTTMVEAATSSTTTTASTATTTSTTVKPATTVYVPQTTTTTLYKNAKCYVNKDCGESYEHLVCMRQPDAVHRQRVAPVCRHPGTREAYCISKLVTEPSPKEVCGPGTHCVDGKCV